MWVDDADLDILQRHGVFVANNPASNMKLGSGFAPIPEMLRRVDMQAQVGAAHDIQNVAANRLGGQVLRMDVVVDANASVAGP